MLTIAEQELGWEAVYFIAGVPGVVLGIVMIATVKEPHREVEDGEVSWTRYDLIT